MDYTSQARQDELNALNGAMLIETSRNHWTIERIKKSNGLLFRVIQEDDNYRHLLDRAEKALKKIEADARKELIKVDGEFYKKFVENINAHKAGLDAYHSEGVDIQGFTTQRVVWIGSSLIQYSLTKIQFSDKLLESVEEAQQALISSD